MQGNTFAFPVVIPGTLTADVTAHFKHGRELQLTGISAKADDTTSFILKVGTAADDDTYYTGTVTGGAAPVLVDDDDFVEAGSPLPWSKEYLEPIRKKRNDVSRVRWVCTDSFDPEIRLEQEYHGKAEEC